MPQQEEVIEWLKQQLECNIVNVNKKAWDNRGPDLCLDIDGNVYYFEAIKFSRTNKGKNQSDFWKAFSQAIARLNPSSEWGRPDKVVILLSNEWFSGWNQRVGNLGSSIWERIGTAFPELEIWFVWPNKCKKYTWNESSNL